jgi:hypothetical protein
MAVVDGSPGLGAAQPVGVNARARVKQSVTARDRQRTSGRSRTARILRVVYLDAVDSWPLRERSPSAKTVWRTDYSAHLDTPWAPYQYWTKAWRFVAVFFALLLDAPKWLLIHPVRGPLTITLFAAGYLAAAHL